MRMEPLVRTDADKYQCSRARSLAAALAVLMLGLALSSACLPVAADEAPPGGRQRGDRPGGCSPCSRRPPPSHYRAKFSDINSGDTAWMLTSTALVLMMTIPGLALFYAGMVRKKNILATLMQSFAITCLVTMLWWVVGYSLAFTPGSTPVSGRLRPRPS